LGGWNETANNPQNATALVITFLLLNYPENQTAANVWEEQWLAIANQTRPGLSISYSAQVRFLLTKNRKVFIFSTAFF